MDAFIKKLCDKYKVLESDVQTLLGCMEEVHFKKRDLIVREGTKTVSYTHLTLPTSDLVHITTKTEQMPPSGSLQTEKQLSPSGDMQTMLIH